MKQMIQHIFLLSPLNCQKSPLTYHSCNVLIKEPCELDKGHGHGGSDMLQYIIIIASLVHFDSLYYILRLHRLSKKMACNPYIEQPANPLILFKNSSHRLLTLHKLGGVVWKAFDRTITHMN